MYSLIILLTISWLNIAHGIVREYYMDGPSTCGQTIIIYDNTINLAARSPISTPNPPSTCTTVLRSGYTDPYYYIKVEWTATIKDCAFSLSIFEGTTPSGSPVKSFRCLGDQENTGVIEVRNSDITVYLTQARDLFQPHNTFNLRITTFRDPSAPELSEGTSKLPTGAVIGIVIGLFALIVFCIVMCWFYKQGKLSFLEKKSMQSYRGGVISSGKSSNIFHSVNGSTGYAESVGNSEASFSSKNWENQQMWASLTHTPTMGRKIKPVTPPQAPPLPSTQGKEKSWESDSQTSGVRDTNLPVMSSSPPRGRRRTKSTEEPPRGRRPVMDSGNIKRNYSNHGYTDQEDYEKENNTNIRKETNVDDVFENNPTTGGILHELKRELSRRQSMKELKTESDTSEKNIADSKEGPASESTPRTSRKANGQPEEMGTFDKSKYAGIDQQSEVGEPDKITNPLLRTNPAIRASVSSLRSRTDESPGSKRKKRKKKYVGIHKKPSTGKGDSMENTTDDSLQNNSFDSVPPAHVKADGPLPPEALAPVFATDASVMQHFYPPQQQNQINEIVLLGYDAYGNAVYGNPHQYQQGGQSYMIDPHGNYIPVPDMSYPGMPGFTSTPGHDSYNTPYHSQHPVPQGQLARTNLMNTMNSSSLVPSGTVLDDPQVPPPGGTIVRSAVDKKTGAQVNQTIWADSKRDPTDPPPGDHNPQISRKTIVRVTTKDATDGRLPSAPDPALQEISFNAAQQIRAHPEEDPAFLSPSKPVRPVTSNGLRTMYASETPERENAAFYSNIQPPAVMETPKTSVMRDAPVKSHAIRDKVTVSREEEEI
ncbi:uncharacterized protein LOC134278256 [Saccostrea cucullata]|uniref:uncharacterized protein LOC134278256 n=1 Tax=Saccostrea cuccullata TaxID=36930 RepID=UPI002ED5B05B